MNILTTHGSRLTAHGSPLPITEILLQEYAGLGRSNEPVTMGLPFPRGLIKDKMGIGLTDPDLGTIPVQTKVLATWPDGSIKWMLLDFLASVTPGITKKITLIQDETDCIPHLSDLTAVKTRDCFLIDTGKTEFHLNTRIFKPFDRVITDGVDVLDDVSSSTVLTDEIGQEYEPVIQKMFCETRGLVRITIKVEGAFKSSTNDIFAAFFSRLHFFADESLVRIEFTIRNPKAARHRGGLWDLGDSGSVFFKDLSLFFSLNTHNSTPEINYQLNDEVSPIPPHASRLTPHPSRSLIIYQDSSGGENWMSRNHLNRKDEVRNSFKGYRVYSGEKVIHEGNRANPVVSLSGEDIGVSATVQYFWQNFPKAFEIKDNAITVRLFPRNYNDVFELQGGEQKTHETFLDFSPRADQGVRLNGVSFPLVPHASPEWYAQSGAFPYLIPESADPNRKLVKKIEEAVSGENNLFLRREIIDEYGWRNFGEFYADHEAAFHKGSSDNQQSGNGNQSFTPISPIISHYNNQYDCIYAVLIQFVQSGNFQWFLLADQLCRHVRDIDIYHTDEDRSEFNRGLFWHTDHYMDVRTATHRCFSKWNANLSKPESYGGGPSLSHNYSTGFLYHYYLTGSPCSADTVLDLSIFTENNIKMEMTLFVQILKVMRKAKSLVKNGGKRHQALVKPDKVYDINGPGRSSGNALNTLINAFMLLGKKDILEEAENLIRWSIHPDDDIKKRDLLDTENRWMYTVFLQYLCEYLDMKIEQGQRDSMLEYAKQSLIHYAEWMAKNEYPYLEKPEKLEYPDETWAAQDIRKSIILWIASQYGPDEVKNLLAGKVDHFYEESIKVFNACKRLPYTRPLVLLITLGSIYTGMKEFDQKDVKFIDEKSELCRSGKDGRIFKRKHNMFSRLIYSLSNMSFRREFLAIKYRMAK
jgi:hypothetical protein